MINLKNVYKEFQLDENVAYTALRNVTLTIKEGEFSSIIGPSGSGKSTLMHIIGLLDKASGGQQQRVAMARALIMEPKLILADEPTGNLDTKTGDEIMKLLGELNKKEKITVVIVTHEPYIAAKTKKQIRIVDGKIV